MTNAMASTASTPSVMSRVRTRRDGRPTLIRGPVGPPPRSGIWKAKVRTSKFAGRMNGPRDSRAQPCNLLKLYSVPGSGHEQGKIRTMSNLSTDSPMAASPLTRAVLEIDAYASGLGWDQPARLFALVDTDQLRAEEPGLAAQLGIDNEAEASLTPVEQDELPAGAPLDEFLATIA